MSSMSYKYGIKYIIAYHLHHGDATGITIYMDKKLLLYGLVGFYLHLSEGSLWKNDATRFTMLQM